MDQLWYNYDLGDGKDQVKCIKQLERICRASLEYDNWARKCKYKDSQDCPICGDNYYDKNSKCESHHHPKTLYTIVEEIMDNHLELNDLDDETGLSIVEEIMDLHTFQKVSYINLCQHCHKKYHAGHPDVNIKMHEIFEKRVRAEMAKDVEEIDDEPLIVSTKEIPIPEEIVIEGDLIINYDSIPEEYIPAPKVESIYVETNSSFISLDIND